MGRDRINVVAIETSFLWKNRKVGEQNHGSDRIGSSVESWPIAWDTEGPLRSPFPRKSLQLLAFDVNSSTGRATVAGTMPPFTVVRLTRKWRCSFGQSPVPVAQLSLHSLLSRSFSFPNRSSLFPLPLFSKSFRNCEKTEEGSIEIRFRKFRTELKRAGRDARVILEEHCRDRDELIGNPR